MTSESKWSSLPVTQRSQQEATDISLQARRLRTETLYRVQAGEMTIFDVLYAALELERDSDGQPVTDNRGAHIPTERAKRLRPLSLRQLLMASSDIGDVSARRIIDQTVQFSTGAQKYNLRRITVGWLVTHYSRGRRWEAFCEAMCDPRRAGFELGFPWSAKEVRNDGPITSVETAA